MSKISRAQRIKRLGARLGSMVLLEFPKKWRENEKKPRNLAISGTFLGGEGENYEQSSGGEILQFLKTSANKSGTSPKSVPA